MQLVRLLAVSLLGVGCAHASSQRAGGADAACDDFQTDVEHVWNEQTKVNVRASLMDRWSGELGVDVARQQSESVASKMDRVAQDWVMLRRAACMDHFKRGVGSAEAYQARARCFDDVLQTQRNVLIGLQNGSVASVSDVSALDGVLDRCR